MALVRAAAGRRGAAALAGRSAARAAAADARRCACCSSPRWRSRWRARRRWASATRSPRCSSSTSPTSIGDRQLDAARQLHRRGARRPPRRRRAPAGHLRRAPAPGRAAARRRSRCRPQRCAPRRRRQRSDGRAARSPTASTRPARCRARSSSPTATRPRATSPPRPPRPRARGVRVSTVSFAARSRRRGAGARADACRATSRSARPSRSRPRSTLARAAGDADALSRRVHQPARRARRRVALAAGANLVKWKAEVAQAGFTTFKAVVSAAPRQTLHDKLPGNNHGGRVAGGQGQAARALRRGRAGGRAATWPTRSSARTSTSTCAAATACPSSPQELAALRPGAALRRAADLRRPGADGGARELRARSRRRLHHGRRREQLRLRRLHRLAPREAVAGALRHREEARSAGARAGARHRSLGLDDRREARAGQGGGQGHRRAARRRRPHRRHRLRLAADQPIVRLQRAANRVRIASDIARLHAGGGTNILPALKEAYDELDPAARQGQARHPAHRRAGQLRRHPRAGATRWPSTRSPSPPSASGSEADKTLLTMIAERGGGRFYFTQVGAEHPEDLHQGDDRGGAHRAGRGAGRRARAQARRAARRRRHRGGAAAARLRLDQAQAAHRGDPGQRPAASRSWRAGASGSARRWPSPATSRTAGRSTGCSGPATASSGRTWCARPCGTRRLGGGAGRSYELSTDVDPPRAHVIVDAIGGDDKFVSGLATTLQVIDPEHPREPRELPMTRDGARALRGRLHARSLRLRSSCARVHKSGGQRGRRVDRRAVAALPARVSGAAARRGAARARRRSDRRARVADGGAAVRCRRARR